jgi:hypothetical protein
MSAYSSWFAIWNCIIPKYISVIPDGFMLDSEKQSLGGQANMVLFQKDYKRFCHAILLEGRANKTLAKNRKQKEQKG